MADKRSQSFISDVFIFSWIFQKVPLLSEGKKFKCTITPLEGGKKILQSCEINFSLHSHIWFYFYSCTRDLKGKALKVNSRFLKCLTVHVPVLFSTSWKIQPIFISAAYPCLSFVLQQHCMFLKIDLDEFHPSFTKTRKRQMVLKNKIYH